MLVSVEKLSRDSFRDKLGPPRTLTSSTPIPFGSNSLHPPSFLSTQTAGGQLTRVVTLGHSPSVERRRPPFLLLGRGDEGDSSDDEGDDEVSDGVEADEETVSSGGESVGESEVDVDVDESGGEGGSGQSRRGSHGRDPPTDSSCSPTSQVLTMSDVTASSSELASDAEDGLKQT